ncbi:MAG: hypothetical protein CMB97_00620 [Flavobacteriaceae bacterium]|nr:hypothetical protein [Flavobacteriaceae bacterium]
MKSNVINIGKSIENMLKRKSDKDLTPKEDLNDSVEELNNEEKERISDKDLKENKVVNNSDKDLRKPKWWRIIRNDSMEYCTTNIPRNSWKTVKEDDKNPTGKVWLHRFRPAGSAVQISDTKQIKRLYDTFNIDVIGAQISVHPILTAKNIRYNEDDHDELWKMEFRTVIDPANGINYADPFIHAKGFNRNDLKLPISPSVDLNDLPWDQLPGLDTERVNLRSAELKRRIINPSHQIGWNEEITLKYRRKLIPLSTDEKESADPFIKKVQNPKRQKLDKDLIQKETVIINGNELEIYTNKETMYVEAELKRKIRTTSINPADEKRRLESEINQAYFKLSQFHQVYLKRTDEINYVHSYIHYDFEGNEIHNKWKDIQKHSGMLKQLYWKRLRKSWEHILCLLRKKDNMYHLQERVTKGDIIVELKQQDVTYGVKQGMTVVRNVLINKKDIMFKKQTNGVVTSLLDLQMLRDTESQHPMTKFLQTIKQFEEKNFKEYPIETLIGIVPATWEYRLIIYINDRLYWKEQSSGFSTETREGSWPFNKTLGEYEYPTLAEYEEYNPFSGMRRICQISKFTELYYEELVSRFPDQRREIMEREGKEMEVNQRLETITKEINEKGLSEERHNPESLKEWTTWSIIRSRDHTPPRRSLHDANLQCIWARLQKESKLLARNRINFFDELVEKRAEKEKMVATSLIERYRMNKPERIENKKEIKRKLKENKKVKFKILQQTISKQDSSSSSTPPNLSPLDKYERIDGVKCPGCGKHDHILIGDNFSINNCTSCTMKCFTEKSEVFERIWGRSNHYKNKCANAAKTSRYFQTFECKKCKMEDSEQEKDEISVSSYDSSATYKDHELTKKKRVDGTWYIKNKEMIHNRKCQLLKGEERFNLKIRRFNFDNNLDYDTPQLLGPKEAKTVYGISIIFTNWRREIYTGIETAKSEYPKNPEIEFIHNIPGGKIEKQDRTPRWAIKRILKEKFNFQGDEEKYKYVDEYQFVNEVGQPNSWILYHYDVSRQEEQILVDGKHYIKKGKMLPARIVSQNYNLRGEFVHSEDQPRTLNWTNYALTPHVKHLQRLLRKDENLVDASGTIIAVPHTYKR